MGLGAAVGHNAAPPLLRKDGLSHGLKGCGAELKGVKKSHQVPLLYHGTEV